MADGRANQLFAGVVTGGGIDDIETGVERAVEQLFDGAHCHILITDFRSAEAENADRESGSAKPPRLHLRRAHGDGGRGLRGSRD